MTSQTVVRPLTALLALSSIAQTSILAVVHANPKSRPYVAYRTDPFDQEIASRRILGDGVELRGGQEEAGGGDPGGALGGGERILKNAVTRKSLNESEGDARCPLSFRLGSTHSAHFDASSRPAAAAVGDGSTVRQDEHTGVGAHTPPVIYPLHPDFDAGSGRQILLTTDYEVLEMWTPGSAIGDRGDFRPESSGGGPGGVDMEGQSTEQLKEDEQFPLLFEGSSFYHTSPVVHDVEGDGIADAILGDYDGNLHLVGLDFEQADPKDDLNGGRRRRSRYYRRVTLPRLFVRKAWYEVAINRTSEERAMANTTADGNHTKWEEFEPYHTYFAGAGDDAWRGKGDDEALRGVSAHVLNMDVDSARELARRRKLKNAPGRDQSEDESAEEGKRQEAKIDRRDEGEISENAEDGVHRRLQEIVLEPADATQDGGDMRRRLQEVVDKPTDANQDGEDMQDAAETNEGDANKNVEVEEGATPDYTFDDYDFNEDPGLFDDAMGAPPDGMGSANGEESNWGDDSVGSANEGIDDYYRGMDDYYGHFGDSSYKPEPPDGWDSYDQYQEAQDRYYHDSNYLRLPPHLLSTCTLAELPRVHAGSSARAEDKVDELILCSVSYYFDEDERRGSSGDEGRSFGRHANADGGDETEELRGRYVANAILGYNLRWKYWSVQEVLDLSTDWSAPLGDIAEGDSVNSDSHNGMGAWALAAPVVAKLDGSDKNHILVGTSMGLVYALEAQWHGMKSGWPVQMRHPVEHQVLVEDVVGSDNLEVFVVDAGGDVVSLTADGAVLWARNLLQDDETDKTGAPACSVRGTSPMSLGDVEGLGRLAIVLLAKIATDKSEELEYRLYAVDAVTGDDLPHFPMALNDGLSISRRSHMPQPLLIDLHSNQHCWLDQIRGLSQEDVDTIRAINIEASKQHGADELSKHRPHGGSGRGLHVVQPLGSTLHIIEGSTSCEQTIDVGDPIPSMVQADDVHGTGGLDLVVTTSRGEILTLESDVVPYHPLNVWSAGAARATGSQGAGAHGFSSAAGIFVHPVSRQFRDVLGIYVPITFEIFDRRRPAAERESNHTYDVEVRAGMSVKRTIFARTYDVPSVYTERIQIPYGPGYYAFSVRLRTAHGIVYEDTFHLGWNVNYMGGLWMIVCLPLFVAAIPILMFKRKPNWEEDKDYGGGSRGTGILGRVPPP